MSDLDPRGLKAAAHAVWGSIDDSTIRGRLYSEDCDHVAATAVRAYLAVAQPVVETVALAAVEAVLELHRPMPIYGDECQDIDCEREHDEVDMGSYWHTDSVVGQACRECTGEDIRPWPCDTVQAITAAPHSNLTQEGDRNE